MSDRVNELADQGRRLPPRECVRLRDLFLESCREPSSSTVDDACTAEIERRVALYESGEAVLHDAEDVMAEATQIAS